MFKWLVLFFVLFAGPAAAQQVQCATRPTGDNSNACASTAWVSQNALTGITGYSNVAAMKAATISGAGLLVQTQGYSTAGDGGNGTYLTSLSNCVSADNGSQIQSNGTGCYYLQVPDSGADPRFWGAKCDGSTDDTTPLSSWVAWFSAGKKGYIPGKCVFKSSLTFPTVSQVTIKTAGMGAGLIYGGTATNSNLVTIGATTGDGSCSVSQWVLEDFTVNSTTNLTGITPGGMRSTTAGDALRFNDFCSSDIRNLTVGNFTNGILAGTVLYNGVHFNGGNTVNVRGHNVSAYNKAIIGNGNSYAQFTNLNLFQGVVVGSLVGVNFAGACGGCLLGGENVLENATNVLIDQSAGVGANQQLFFDATTQIDSTTAGVGQGVGIDINDAGSNNSRLYMTGTWNASANKGAGSINGHCIYIRSGSQFYVQYTGGSILNCAGDGIRNDSTTSIVELNHVQIGDFGPFVNGGYGINNTVLNNYIILNQVIFGSNTGGNTNGAITTSPFITLSVADTSSNNITSLSVSAQYDSNGVNIKMTSQGTYPNKYLRNTTTGQFQILNSAYSIALLNLTEGGVLTVPGTFVASGTAPTITGCSTSTQVGGATVGTFKATAICAIASSYALTALPASTNGYVCDLIDRTTAGVVFQQTADSTTSATMTVRSVATANNDIIQFKCMGY